MKKFFILLTAIVLMGCSSDDDNSNTPSSSFTFDGTSYELIQGMSMIEIVTPEVLEFNGETFDRSTISIAGMNGSSSTATVSFDLYYKTGTTVEGTYNIYDSEDDGDQDFEEFIAGDNRGCMGWTSAAFVFSSGDGSDMINGNNPTGSVQVIVNSPTNYTLKYSGVFREYDDEFEFVRNMPTEINVSSNVTVN